MFPRKIETSLHKYLEHFPAVVLTGARQVGKTELVKACLPHYRYVLLENPDLRAQALDDPLSFLDRFPPPVIFDEFQYVPQLTSYLQEKIDQSRNQKGNYVLTGSQNFLMMEQITQSLAGRVGLLSLYGLSYSENPLSASTEEDILSLILRGSYPELWKDLNYDPHLWFPNYLRTYIERDLRNLTQVSDLSLFERFVRLCAIHTGQILNLSNLARDCGISQTTANRWISLLEQSYIITLMEPFYENLKLRIRKSPKLYFLDTGLAAYLMGFRSKETLLAAPQLGALFETLVISNFIKEFSHQGEIPEHYYIKSKTGIEVDLIIKNILKWDLYEIKYKRSLRKEDGAQLIKIQEHLGEKAGSLNILAPVSEAYKLSSVQILPWYRMHDNKLS